MSSIQLKKSSRSLSHSSTRLAPAVGRPNTQNKLCQKEMNDLFHCWKMHAVEGKECLSYKMNFHNCLSTIEKVPKNNQKPLKKLMNKLREQGL